MLRLYGSIAFVPKSTGFHTQTIETSKRKHVLPPKTAVIINMQALHTDPNLWFQTSWNGNRIGGFASPLKSRLVPSQEEILVEPERGSYVPWADGPRVCVERNSSQVEFVGVISTLFYHHKVRPAAVDGHEGRQALVKMINQMGIKYITVQMKRPKDVALIWEKR